MYTSNNLGPVYAVSRKIPAGTIKMNRSQVAAIFSVVQSNFWNNFSEFTFRNQ